MAMIETQSAKFFVKVAQARSLSRAAMELGTTQSNVTTRMRLLEEQVGVVLLNRHSRGVDLTAAGAALLPHCQELLRVAEAAYMGATKLNSANQELRIGCYFTAASYLLPEVLSEFIAANRGIHLAVTIESTEELRSQLMANRLDCVVIAGVGVDSRMTVHARIADEFGWIFKKGLLPPSIKDPLAVLSSMPIYSTKKGSLYEASVRQLFQDDGVVAAMPVFQELGSVEILRAVLKLGHGFTFISKHVFKEELAAGIFEFLPAATLPRLHPVLVSKKTGANSGLINDFAQYLKKYAGRRNA